MEMEQVSDNCFAALIEKNAYVTPTPGSSTEPGVL